MELLKDLGVVMIRVVTIFPLMLAVTLFMGRRTIGEMPVFDFLIIIALGAVVGADIADPNIEHIPTIFVILLVALLQKLFSISAIRYRRFGKLISFEPIIIVYQGKLIHKNMKKIKYSVDNVLHMLREEQIFDLKDVHLCVVESNGRISVLEKTEPPQPEAAISFPIIKEGKIEVAILSRLGISEAWVRQQLAQRQLALDSVFLATVDQNKILSITLYEEEAHQSLPPIIH